MRMRTVPREGCNLDGVTSMTSHWTRRVSPGLTGRGQRNSSTPLPMTPSDSGRVCTRSCIVTAVVCHPLATSRLKNVGRAVASSRWNGCGSNSPANLLIHPASTTARASDVNTCPGVRSSRKALSTAFSFDEARGGGRASAPANDAVLARRGRNAINGRLFSPASVRCKGGSGHQISRSKRRLLRHRVISSTHRHRAGRDGDSEHLGDGGVVKAVLHLADRPDHAMLGGSRVGGRLEQCLVRAQAWLLVDLGARIPEQNLRRNVAGDRLAAGVEEGDAFLPGSVEQVVGLYEHRGDGQPLTGLRRDLELEGSPGLDISGTAGADRRVGGAHMDDARLTLQGFLKRARWSIFRQRLESLAAVRLAGCEQRRAVRVMT